MKIQLSIAWLIAFAGVLFYYKFDYLSVRFSFYTGLVLLPFLVRRVGVRRLLNLEGLVNVEGVKPSMSWRYFWAALPFAAVLFFERSNMAFYFCTGFAMLFVAEVGWGRLNHLSVFAWVVMSPVFQYVADIWSFSIRLKMSGLAAEMLQNVGFAAEASGNVISLDGAEFSVDPACMGLNLLSTSLLLTLLLLAFFERQKNHVFTFFGTAGWLFLALLLSLLANFMRLLALVVFKVLPDNPMHDVWGLASLLVYVFLPLFLLVRRNSCSGGAQRSDEGNVLQATPRLNWGSGVLCPALLLGCLLFFGNAPDHEPVFQNEKLAAFQLPGFQSSLTENGMLKLENDSALIYLKPPSGFLRASHDPRICWRGSGYEFQRVQNENIGGVEVYSAELVKGDDLLFTCWWYDNGQNRTVEEWDWRWAGLLGDGKGFYLVNVTCGERAALELEIAGLAKQNIIGQFVMD